MKNKMIEEEVLKNVFWENGNILTTKDGAELEYQDDGPVDFSVLLRNEQEQYEENYQLYKNWDSLGEFIAYFSIEQVSEVYELSVLRLLEMYCKGEAELRFSTWKDGMVSETYKNTVV